MEGRRDTMKIGLVLVAALEHRVAPCLPGSDRGPAPLFGLHIADGLGQLPAVASDVLQNSGALAVLPGRQVFDDARPLITGAGERLIDVGHADLDQVCHAAAVRRDPIAADVRDDDGTVIPDAQLGTVRITDSHPLPKAECSLQPRNRRSHILVDQHGRHGGRRCRAIRQHAATTRTQRLRSSCAIRRSRRAIRIWVPMRLRLNGRATASLR